MGTATVPEKKRGRPIIPWEFIIIAALAVVAVGLIIFALLPPTPPPYVT